MQLIDSHAHIYLEDFDADISEVVERAKKVNVQKILLPNIDNSTLASLNRLCKAYPDFFLPMIGMHPTSVKEDHFEALEKLFEGVDFGNYIAIGEIGIDLYWDKSFIKNQLSAFEFQIYLAKKNKLPIVIHARDSFGEIFSVIDRLNDDDLKGVFHCFTGTESDANKIIEYGGFKMGIGGIVTFKNS